MNKMILGECSLCGGNVTIDTVTWSVIPPVASCENCGAVEKRPVIEMKPARTKTATQIKLEDYES